MRNFFLKYLNSLNYRIGRITNLIKLKNAHFYEEFEQLKSQEKSSERYREFNFSKNNLFPIINEKTENTAFEPHYTYFPAWATRIIKEINPKIHVDISSSLKFVNVLSAFIPVDFYDYRPARLKLSNLNCGKADLNNLPFDDNSIESLSCLHVVEHIGLGRYGDSLDFDGDIKAIAELKRVVKKEGNLLFVVPMGYSRINFNAHRFYSKTQITNYFADFELLDFKLVPDDYLNLGLVDNPTNEFVESQKNGCGCFWFKKK